MTYFALLSGPNPALSQLELDTLVKMERVMRKKRVLLFEANKIENGKRAALTHFVGELIAEGEMEKIVDAKIDVKGSFMARAVRVPRGVSGDMPALEAALGEHILAQNDDAWVDLRNPKTVVKIVVTPELCYLVKLHYHCERDFFDRHPTKRPIFHPSCVHSKLARVMVNLAGIKKGDLLLDPFCGPGGLLLEGASIGARVFGVDADPKMAEGARKNLAYFGFDGEIQDGLAQEIKRMFKFKFDAIVTDPPYGRNASIKKGGLNNLFLAQAKKVLKENGRMVLTSDKDITEMLENYFTVVGHESIPVHKSMTRELFVLEVVD